MDRLMKNAASAAGMVVSLFAGSVRADTPFASQVVSYTPGSGVNPVYTDPWVALGEPARMSGQAIGFPSVVSPFAGAWEPTDVVSVGRAGSLVLRFGRAIADDPANPFGIDLLVFGNSFYQDASPDFSGVAGALFSGGGTVEVSDDGIDWRVAAGAEADGAFPTLGYSDITDPYSSVPGNVLSDFTLPLDPSFDATGKTFAQIRAGYNGSGGGAGIDIGTLGFSEVSYVRITNAADAARIVEIDAMADVTPIPAPWTLGLLCAPLLRRKR